MKKNILFALFACTLLWVSCDQREIPLYDTARHMIEFENETTDSTIFTFIYHPHEDYYDLPLVMQLGGVAAERDLTYKVVVDEEFTTATSAHYSVADSYIFRAGRYQDTCFVRLNKTADLDGTQVRLVLRLEGTSDMEVGKLENAIAVIRFSNTIDRPVWWDSDIETFYLGTYSQKKFLLYLEIGGVDLTDASDSMKRAYALKFKQYLLDHAGEPETIEEDGQPMTAPVLGLE